MAESSAAKHIKAIIQAGAKINAATRDQLILTAIADMYQRLDDIPEQFTAMGKKTEELQNLIRDLTVFYRVAVYILGPLTIAVVIALVSGKLVWK